MNLNSQAQSQSVKRTSNFPTFCQIATVILIRFLELVVLALKLKTDRKISKSVMAQGFQFDEKLLRTDAKQ